MSFVLLGMLSSCFAASEAGALEAAAIEDGVKMEEVIAQENKAVLNNRLVEVIATRKLPKDELLAEVKRLLALGASPDSRDGNDNPILREAVSRSYGYPFLVEVVKMLVEAGADVNATGFENHTALMSATHRADLVSLLLDAGADVNANSDVDGTTLMRACGRGRDMQPDIITLLLVAGADVNVHNPSMWGSGWTALMKAVYQKMAGVVHDPFAVQKSSAVARLLVLAGADINAKTRDRYPKTASTLQIGFGFENLFLQVLADKKLYESRVDGVSSALEACTSLSAEVADIVKDYEVEDEFAFLRERELNLKKKAQAAALRYRTLIRYLGQSLQEAYPLMDMVLEYAAEISVTAPAQAGEAEEDEKEQAQ